MRWDDCGKKDDVEAADPNRNGVPEDREWAVGRVPATAHEADEAEEEVDVSAVVSAT